MRLFVAVDPEASVKRSIGGFARKLKDASRRGRFVDPDHYHITLAFLGETDPGLVPLVAAVMDRAVLRSRPFELEFSGLGSFPSRGGEILWIGVAGGRGELEEIRRRLAEGFAGADLPMDGKPFNPHLTLARKAVLDPVSEKASAEGGRRSWKTPVDRIVLMESVRIEGRLSYVPIHESRF